MTFNIKKLAILPFANMPVRDAAGEIQKDPETGVELSITFHSPGTKEHQKAKHAREERNNTRVLGRMQNKSESKVSAEDAAKERAEYLASVTKSFNGFALEGKTGHEMFKAVYADIEIGHIADDSEKWQADRGNFLKPSQATSSDTSGTQPG